MDKKRRSLEFILVGLAWRGRLFKDTYFIHPLELEANDSPKLSFLKAFNISINIFKINTNIFLYCVFSWNIFECLEYHQHKYYHNQLENHRYICIILSFSYYQLKNFLKSFLNITELHLFQNLLLWICMFQYRYQIFNYLPNCNGNLNKFFSVDLKKNYIIFFLWSQHCMI